MLKPSSSGFHDPCIDARRKCDCHPTSVPLFHSRGDKTDMYPQVGRFVHNIPELAALSTILTHKDTEQRTAIGVAEPKSATMLGNNVSFFQCWKIFASVVSAAFLTFVP